MNKDSSFSAEVRLEITGCHPKPCCRRFLLAAFMEAARSYQIYNGLVMRFNSLNTAGFAVKVLRSFDLDFLWTRSASSTSDKKGNFCEDNCRYIIKLMEEPKLGKTKRCLNFLNKKLLDIEDTQQDLRFWIPPNGSRRDAICLNNEEKEEHNMAGGKTVTFNLCCRRRWLSGLFLAFGSVSDPQRTYCLEWAMPSDSLAEQAAVCLKLDGLSPSLSERRHAWVVSLKRASDIAEALSIMGANLARLNFEKVLALKETRNDVRRRVNAESANMARSSLASVRQIGCLRLLQKEGVLESLPADLRAIAAARLENPEASLRELGYMFSPAIPRTTLNRKLSKLEALSREFGEPDFEDLDFV
ncbi:MAG: DNA-binding protein WhiA [Candidatus Bruticola sp.]